MRKMKFSQLPVGTAFTFQGERYTKSSPIVASRDSDGGTRMVPRSATVELEGDQKSTVTEVISGVIQATDVSVQFEQFYSACLRHLEDLPHDMRETLAYQLRHEHDQFLAAITQMAKSHSG